MLDDMAVDGIDVLAQRKLGSGVLAIALVDPWGRNQPPRVAVIVSEDVSEDRVAAVARHAAAHAQLNGRLALCRFGCVNRGQ